jgi:hypothetical protein
MGSKRRQEAIAAGLPVENAEAARRRRRAEAAIMREELAIELWAAGKTSAEISQAMYDRWGVKLVSSVPELVRRGLYRRVQEGSEDADVARELFRVRYQGLLSKWYELATGTPPDPKAADIVLRILRDWGVVEGIVAPPRSGDINLNILNGVQMDDQEMRDKVLASLAAESAKQKMVKTIEGESFTPEVVEDGKIPPPAVVLPKRPD